MAPLTLDGDNLGQRHRCLNSLVNEAYQQNASLQTLLERPEMIPIERIFKIDLASKHKSFDFIVENLKEKDMLFVSRALKCRWLLENEYSHTINPAYLEGQLYPAMTTTAVNKMKTFIELNLKDPKRCQEFYEYYKSNFDEAIKFLWHCSKEFIRGEVLNIIDRISPKHLRILCEACPEVAKEYFAGLQKNKQALVRYVEYKNEYHNSIKNVLKCDADVFLDITEKYFDRHSIDQLSPSATKYIMKNHKERYLNKPELYAGWLLNIKTLAFFLNGEEIKDIVTRLARAEYLGYTLTYKHVEPLIKRLSAEERSAIKKKIFLDKSYGDTVEDWPYQPPERLELMETYYEPLKDIQHHAHEYKYLQKTLCRFPKRMIKKKKCDKYACMESISIKSPLDTLFNRYRFMNFEKTFFEFRKMLLTESTIEGRRNMILVLVSKTGGIHEKIDKLLKFLVERHSNEPDNLRDAIARSIVKRAFAWRLPAETWELLLKWATTSVREILHTNILRHLLADSVCPQDTISAYVLDFSDLTEYSLNAEEKLVVRKRLPELLVSANAPSLFLDTIAAYNLRVESIVGAKDMLVEAAQKDEDLLRCVFKLRVARRHLLRATFNIIQTDAAYMNALKHDVFVLKNGESFVSLISNEKARHDRFLRSLVLYFSEPDGLAASHFKAIEKAVNEEWKTSFARPLAFLVSSSGKSFKDYAKEIDTKSSEVTQKKFMAALRANASVTRPLLDIDILDWRVAGAKFVSNKVLVCSDTELTKYIQKCLQWKKTMRVALQLARRNNSLNEVLEVVTKKRPIVALKLFLSDLRKDKVDVNIWNQIKPILLNLDLSKTSLQHIVRVLDDLEPVQSIEAEYWSCLYKAYRRISELKAMPMLCKIENLATEVEDDVLKVIVRDFLSDKLNTDLIMKNDFPETCICLYFRIIGKYLLKSVNISDQNDKVKTVDTFFDKLEIIWNELDNKEKLVECLNDFLQSLKYSQAFMNAKYVSCVPMFERILEKLPKLLPREKYFAKYVYIHVTMLYYRSIRQALKQRPEYFNDLKRMNDGIITIGFTLGKYISIELRELLQNYFRSLIEIYQEVLVEFLNSFEYNDSRRRLVTALIKALIEGQGDSLLLAQYLYAKMQCEESEDILKLLKEANNEEMKFFLYADINPY